MIDESQRSWIEIRKEFMDKPQICCADAVTMKEIQNCFSSFGLVSDVPPVIMELILSLEKRIRILEECEEK